MTESERPKDAQDQQPDRAEPADGPVPAWEQIEPGRYIPRRIRGSFRGGKLG
jgi:hypothetical protein